MLEKPDISNPLTAEFVSAFFALSSCRLPGFGLTPIPWTAIKQYADNVQNFGLSFDIFEYIIRYVDGEYIRASEKPHK
jgi:hypothetical protein